MSDDNNGPSASKLAEQLKLQQSLNQAQEDYLKLLNESKTVQELHAKAAARWAQSQKEAADNIEKQYKNSLNNNQAIEIREQLAAQEAETSEAQYKALLANQEKEEQAFKRLAVAREENLKSLIKGLEEKGKKNDGLNEKDAKQYKLALERLEEHNQAKVEFLKYQEKQREKAKELAQAMGDYNTGLKNVNRTTDSWANKLTGVTANSFNNSIFKSIGMMGGFENALSQVGKQLITTFNPANVAAGILQKIGESTMTMVVATDKAQASFYKTTGAAEDYNATINTVRTEAASFGVNIEEAGEAVTELFQSMSQFTQLTKQAQVEVASFSATMAELGVSNATTAQTLDFFTRGLGKGTDAAMNMSKEITKSAQVLGMSVGKMHEDFNAALPTLAAYGDEAIKVFQGLAAAAKETGVETSRLLDIASQFDTFDSAAESVGRLNGILGGNYLNSLEMVNMSEEERIRAMIQATQASGRAFNELGRFEKKAIASAVGITDMAEANKVFGLSLSEYDRLVDKSKAGAMSQEEMAEQADKARTAQEKLTNLMQSMAIAVQPIITVLTGFLDGLLAIQKFMGPFFAPALALLAGSFIYLKVQAMRTTAVLAAHSKVMALDSAIKAGAAAENKALMISELNRMKAKGIGMGMLSADTAAELTNASAKGVSSGMTLKQIMTEKGSIGTKITKIGTLISETAATWLNTLGIGANTNAEKVGILAKFRAVAAGAAKLAGTLLLTAAEYGLTAAVYAGAAAWVFLKVVWGGFVALATMVASALGLTASGATGTAAAAVPAAAGIGALSAAAMAGAKGLLILAAVALGLGAAFALIGLGIKLAADGIVRIAEAGGMAIAVLGGLALLMGALALGAFLLAKAGPVALVGMLLLAAGFMAIAFALMFISTEDLQAVGEIFKGFENLATAAAGIVMVNVALVSLLSTLEEVGEEASTFTWALGSLAASMWSLGIAMMFLDMKKLTQVGALFTSLSKMTATNNALTQTAAGISAIADAIDKMPMFGTIAFSWLLEDLQDFGEVGTSITAPMKATTEFIQSAQKVEETHVKNATKLIDQVVRYAGVVEGGSFAAATNNFLNELVKVLGGTSDDKKKEEKGQDIYLVMDDAGQKVLASAVNVQINKKHSVYSKGS